MPGDTGDGGRGRGEGRAGRYWTAQGGAKQAGAYPVDPRGPQPYQRPQVYTEDGQSNVGYAWMAERDGVGEMVGDRGPGPERNRAFPSGRREPRPGPFTGRGPKGYRRADERIRDDVCEALTEHPLVDAGEVEVEVRDGEVTLSGTVADRQQKRFAEDAADAVIGVRDVQNRLRVRRGAETPTGDDERGVHLRAPDPGTTDDMIDVDAERRRTGPGGLERGTPSRAVRREHSQWH